MLAIFPNCSSGLRLRTGSLLEESQPSRTIRYHFRVMASHSFAPNFDMPDRLRARIDAWEKAAPKWQHKAYGPLNAYLGLRFPPTHFLVKPQALLREEVATTTGATADDEEGKEGYNEDEDDAIEEHMDSDDSIDSHGM